MSQARASSPAGAQALAPQSHLPDAVAHPTCMLARVGRRWLAIDARMIEEVSVKGAIARVPTAPRHVLGVTGLRGGLVPVVSLEQMLGSLGSALPESTPSLPRLVVVAAADYEVALVVDEIRGLIEAIPTTHETDSDTPGWQAFLRDEFEWEGYRVGILDVAGLVVAAAGRTPGSD
jgi:chemotaxis signal transduction protein